jgi:XTP/dITP diphosphohydrolase
VLAASGLPVELVPRPADVPDVDEAGATLEDNARLKAQALVTATRLPALADDTGLEVVALDGAPGVRSARFAGDHATAADNTAKLLSLLDGVADDRRIARFATVALVRWPDGREVAAIGTVEGSIVREPRGTGGFGYDPVFQPAGGGGRTFAEMSAAEKHAISHRGRALRTLAAGLRAVEGASA